ncbi:MAG: YraN family protein [Bacteroidota bacterium]
MTNQNKRKTGNYGEDLACKFLEKSGYKIIERNYIYEHGEIDIVAKDGDELVFVEVKYRTNLEYGPPEFAISKGKQRLIRKTAEAYLYERDIKDQICRIDVAAILHIKGSEPQINHIINAF